MEQPRSHPSAVFFLPWLSPLITPVAPGPVLSNRMDPIPLIFLELSLDPWIQVSLKISTCSRTIRSCLEALCLFAPRFFMLSHQHPTRYAVLACFSDMVQSVCDFSKVFMSNTSSSSGSDSLECYKTHCFLSSLVLELDTWVLLLFTFFL